MKLPIMLSQQTINVHFSLATFLSDSAQETFLYKFLSKIELFNIWFIAVLCIGIAVMINKDAKKIWPIVAGLYLVWYLGSSAVGGFFG